MHRGHCGGHVGQEPAQLHHLQAVHHAQRHVGVAIGATSEVRDELHAHGTAHRTSEGGPGQGRQRNHLQVHKHTHTHTHTHT